MPQGLSGPRAEPPYARSMKRAALQIIVSTLAILVSDAASAQVLVAPDTRAAAAFIATTFSSTVAGNSGSPDGFGSFNVAA